MRNITGIPHAPRPDAGTPKITIEYGHAVAGARPYRVEFTFAGERLISRYLDPLTPWEERERTLDNAAVLDRITQTLRAYLETDDSGTDPHEEKD